MVSGNRVEERGGERSVDAVEEFQEDEADRISVGRQTVAAGVGQFFDKAFRAKLGEIVPKGGQAILLCSTTDGDDVRIDFAALWSPVGGCKTCDTPLPAGTKRFIRTRST